MYVATIPYYFSKGFKLNDSFVYIIGCKYVIELHVIGVSYVWVHVCVCERERDYFTFEEFPLYCFHWFRELSTYIAHKVES
jgi:hypothetical protein